MTEGKNLTGRAQEKGCTETTKPHRNAKHKIIAKKKDVHQKLKRLKIKMMKYIEFKFQEKKGTLDMISWLQNSTVLQYCAFIVAMDQ